jgi:hypothetical protein
VRFAWKLRTLGIAVAGSCLLFGCGTGSAATSAGPPENVTAVQTSNAWFRAINAKNQDEVVSFFRHPDHFGWGQGKPSGWPTFSNVHCRSGVTIPAGETTVQCTFNESATPSAGNIDKFWNISLSRGRHATWLIDNYGQG